MRHHNRIVSIGAGPANISLAALLDDSIKNGENAPFHFSTLEKKQSINWHPGQLFPATTMQSSFARDLVTLADPTNKYTFLNFLKTKNRLMQFLNSGIFFPYRAEFTEYFHWVCSQIPNIEFNYTVQDIWYDKQDNNFTIVAECEKKSKTLKASHVIVGSGPVPYIPISIEGLPRNRIIHVSDFLSTSLPENRKRVLIVGAGQSSAELILYLLREDAKVSEIDWISRSVGIPHLNTSNFAREYYTASYAEYFFQSPDHIKEQISKEEESAGKGISPNLTEELYQEIYRARFVEKGSPRVRILPGNTLLSAQKEKAQIKVSIQNHKENKTTQNLYDLVILCTGFKDNIDAILSGCVSQPSKITENSKVHSDYSISNADIPRGRLFIQSGARECFGLSDPNFTMVCHRNTKILNSIFEEALFPTASELLVDWSQIA